jgi:spore coat polysaccharide biosynthesis protein SpsF (cytidylyltransferase family)
MNKDLKNLPKIVAVIQTRASSTRLPEKVLLPLNGKTVFEIVHERVSSSKYIPVVVIATTTNPNDDKIFDLCKKKNIEVFRGSEEDVLDRYYQAAKKYGAEQVVRITSDCPLIDPDLIDKTIELHFNEGNDYTATAYVETFPDGEDMEIFSFDSLRDAWENATEGWHREHATKYITHGPKKFKIGNLVSEIDLSGKRWTLDEPNDYKFIKKIYDELGDKNHLFGIKEILEFLEKNPELEKINQHIIRNEGLLKSIEKEKNKKKGSDGKRSKTISKS